jgi:hypothetical protein
VPGVKLRGSKSASQITSGRIPTTANISGDDTLTLRAKLEHGVQGHEILSTVCSSDRHPFRAVERGSAHSLR